VFATPTAELGCAPELQCSLFASLSRAGAWPLAAKSDLRAWLSRYAAGGRFLGAGLQAAHAGRTGPLDSWS
jgi:hypothetical protein